MGILKTRRFSQRDRRGIVIVAVCVSLLLMLAGIGLGVDLNRFLAAREALAARAEGSALAAVLELDGTAEGVARARVRAASRWGRNEAMTLEFAESGQGPWKVDPVGVAELRAARVRASSEMPLSLLRSVVNQESLRVSVAGRAEQREMESVSTGLLPFAVETNRPGRVVRLPEALTTATPARAAILTGVPFAVRPGQILPALNDATPQVTRETIEAIVASDSDPAAASYAEYQAGERGNGRRVVLLPVVDAERRRVTGFGGFLLLPDAMHVEAIGSYLQGSRFQAAARTGAWRAEVVTR